MIGKRLKHYQVEELLGKGGMGIVYRALDVRLRRPVAVKVLKSELTTDPDRKRRFLQEARSASAIIHPAIAQVYDVDEVDGVTFMAMEFVEGKTVRQLITDRELDLQGSVEIALQVAEGLARAHEAGIVHRDIKSDNIMLTRDGHAKILDFGLAKLLDPTAGSGEAESDLSARETLAQTRVGTVLGTIAYMSPEQARGQRVNQSSDIFSMGIVLYEMVTGELPFKGDSPLDTMHAIAYEEIRPLTVIRRNLPPELHRIVQRCLRKRPEDRYPDGQGLAADLRVLKRDLDSGVQRAVPAGDRMRESFEWLKSSMPFGFAGIAVAVALMGLVGYLLFSKDDFGTFVVLALIALPIYRFIRNRRQRLVKRFVAKISKLPEVRAILVRDEQLSVIVDQAKAKMYIRINSLVDTINRKRFFGEPVKAEVRDDLSPEDLQKDLRKPGVVYVREDVLEE